MGLLIDTNVFILAERRRQALDWSAWQDYGVAFISVITASELLTGIHRAQTDAQRTRRTAFVEGILAGIAALPVDLEVARIHASLLAQLPRHETVGTHDVWIAATAVRHGMPVLTGNTKDFEKLAGVQVIGLP